MKKKIPPNHQKLKKRHPAEYDSTRVQLSSKRGGPEYSNILQAQENDLKTIHMKIEVLKEQINMSLKEIQ